MTVAPITSGGLPKYTDVAAGSRHRPDFPIASLKLDGNPFVFRCKQEIFGEGEEAKFFYRVMAGAVRSYNVLSDGRRQVNAFHLSGDLFGLAAGPRHHQSAEAIVETRVTVFSRRQFDTLAQHDVHLAYELWASALRQLEHTQDHVLLIGRRSALERVAAFLIEIERPVDSSGWFVLLMTRRDIADYLGLTIETVSRALTQLEAERALIRAGARRIRLAHTVLREILDD